MYPLPHAKSLYGLTDVAFTISQIRNKVNDTCSYSSAFHSMISCPPRNGHQRLDGRRQPPGLGYDLLGDVQSLNIHILADST